MGYWSGRATFKVTISVAIFVEIVISNQVLNYYRYIGLKSVTYPPEFNVHPHLEKTFVKARTTKVTEGEKIDWATAEAMAFGSLMYQGFDVRISGEDVVCMLPN